MARSLEEVGAVDKNKRGVDTAKIFNGVTELDDVMSLREWAEISLRHGQSAIILKKYHGYYLLSEYLNNGKHYDS